MVNRQTARPVETALNRARATGDYKLGLKTIAADVKVESLKFDQEKNRVCPASSLPDTPTSFARMHVLGNRADQALSAHPDIREWANQTTLNPARIPPERLGDPEIAAALERYRNNAVAGFGRLAEFAAST